MRRSSYFSVEVATPTHAGAAVATLAAGQPPQYSYSQGDLHAITPICLDLIRTQRSSYFVKVALAL